MSRLMSSAVIMSAVLCLAQCSRPAPRQPAAAAPQISWRPYQTGIASWYRDHRTASGERFNSAAYAAAHRTLPFGTMVRVTNLRNGRSCVVRINDRGPFIRGRVIDVTRAPAQHLGLTSSGIARVRLDVVRR